MVTQRPQLLARLQGPTAGQPEARLTAGGRATHARVCRGMWGPDTVLARAVWCAERKNRNECDACGVRMLGGVALPLAGGRRGRKNRERDDVPRPVAEMRSKLLIPNLRKFAPKRKKIVGKPRTSHSARLNPDIHSHKAYVRLAHTSPVSTRRGAVGRSSHTSRSHGHKSHITK